MKGKLNLQDEVLNGSGIAVILNRDPFNHSTGSCLQWQEVSHPWCRARPHPRHAMCNLSLVNELYIHISLSFGSTVELVSSPYLLEVNGYPHTKHVRGLYSKLKCEVYFEIQPCVMCHALCTMRFASLVMRYFAWPRVTHTTYRRTLQVNDYITRKA